jgi:hypothetical protein
MTCIDLLKVAVWRQRVPAIHSFRAGCDPGQQAGVSRNTLPNLKTGNTLLAIIDSSDR